MPNFHRRLPPLRDLTPLLVQFLPPFPLDPCTRCKRRGEHVFFLSRQTEGGKGEMQNRMQPVRMLKPEDQAMHLSLRIPLNSTALRRCSMESDGSRNAAEAKKNRSRGVVLTFLLACRERRELHKPLSFSLLFPPLTAPSPPLLPLSPVRDFGVFFSLPVSPTSSSSSFILQGWVFGSRKKEEEEQRKKKKRKLRRLPMATRTGGAELFSFFLRFLDGKFTTMFVDLKRL